MKAMRDRNVPLGLMLTCLVSGLLLGGVVTETRAFQGAATERKVTVNLKDVPLRQAVDLLFAGTGLQYAVDPNVLNVPVNLTIRDVGIQAALRLVIRQASTAQPGITMSRDGEIYHIALRKPAPPAVITEDLPPEYTGEKTEFVWEKIPIQFNNVAVFVMAFGGQMLPSEADVLLGGQGNGQNGQLGQNGQNGQNGLNGQNGSGFGGGIGNGLGTGSGLNYGSPTSGRRF
jgi:hypothetical protein